MSISPTPGMDSPSPGMENTHATASKYQYIVFTTPLLKGWKLQMPIPKNWNCDSDNRVYYSGENAVTSKEEIRVVFYRATEMTRAQAIDMQINNLKQMKFECKIVREDEYGINYSCQHKLNLFGRFISLIIIYPLITVITYTYRASLNPQLVLQGLEDVKGWEER